MQLIQNVKAKDVAKYTLLPGIIPRIKEFVQSGFGWLAFTMAIVYNGVRLLPNGHPYLNASNMGKFGIRHVIAEAANNLVIKKENIDQIIIFFALLVAFLLLFLQCAALIIGIFIEPAAAFAGIFTTPTCVGSGAACLDIAHMLMDKVFAVPDMFNSKFAPPAGLGGIPAFNRALQELFQYYSFAILVVAVVIFLYYVIVLVGETANTGTPFGRRFNHVYAPLRLVAAIGFLVPLNYGYNSAQYITLFAAKFGSGFATFGWTTFNASLAASGGCGGNVNAPTGVCNQSLIARPQIPDITHIVAFMSVVRTCEVAYEMSFPNAPNDRDIRAWLVTNNPAPNAVQMTNVYQLSLQFYQNEDIHIVFGQRYPAGTPDMNYVGNVEPVCGMITIPTNVATLTGAPPGDQTIGAYRIQEAFHSMIFTLAAGMNTQYNNLGAINGGNDLVRFGGRLTAIHTGMPDDPAAVTGLGGGDATKPPPAEWKSTVTNTLARTAFIAAVANAYNETVALAGTLYDIPPALLERGWAGAAIWYNHIAEWNGTLFTALIHSAKPSRMPDIMERIQEERRAHNEATESENRYEPTQEGFRAITFQNNREQPIAKALSGAYKYWIADGSAQPSDQQTSSNVFFDLLNTVFGIGGLFTMRNNDDVHPLAQLSALGKSIVESSIRNLMTALVFSVGGGMGEIMGSHLGAAMNAISSMFIAFTSIGLTIGFILYYVLPFLPFMYFFFAVGGWVKTIFEAMVGVPLWALAHLKLDGNGFPGDSASNGYFLIFEIFVRPILIVFGLVASMTIFTAMARTLNGVFDLVIENLTGFDCADCNTATIVGLEFKRNVIDEFFFTIIYTVLVYMLATSSFKMIDQIPNSILRWMGAGVQSFSDQAGDPAGNLVQYAAFGGANIAGQMTGALQQGAKTAGQAIGTPFGLMMRNGGPDRIADVTRGNITPGGRNTP